MSKPKPILNKLYLLLFIFIALTIVITNSCKKDNHTAQQNTVPDPIMAQAKNWYESTYPVNTGKQSTLTTGTNSDLSQIIKPDWQHNASYTRFNKKVIELPLDPSSKFNPVIKNMATSRSSNSAYSRSSFILMNNGSGYDAYVMTLIADSAYLKNDPGKLERNKYNKRDADYSGLVLYFTPKGKYINGWRYKDGRIVLPGNPGNSTGVKVQSVGTSRVKTMSEDCYDYNLVAYTNGRVEYEIYMFTMCSGGDGGRGNDGPGGNIGSPGDGGGGGGTGEGPTPPGPCNSAIHSGPVPVIQSGGKLKVNSEPSIYPEDNEGFPSPEEPCTVEVSIRVPDIIDSLSKKYPCTKALIDALPNLNTNIAKLLFQAFDSKDGNNIIFLEGDAARFPANTKLDAVTDFDNDNGFLTNKIYINPAILANASNEYRLVTLYHEAIHAFLNSEHTKLTTAAFTAKYPMINIVERQNFSQVVNADKYDYYIDPAYQMKVIDNQHLTMAEYFINDLKNAILAYNPNFPPERATALAQTGIIQNKSPMFVNYNDMERDVTKNTSAGTKCTP